MTAPANLELDRTTRLALVTLAVAQAGALMLLHKALQQPAWPATDLRWLFALYALALGWPLFFYLGAASLHERATAPAAVVVAAVLFWLGWHTGWVVQPAAPEAAGALAGGRAGAWLPPALATAVAVFIAALLFRTWRETGGRALPYARLLELSWSNLLTLVLLAAFVGAFWLLLRLWAGLFAVLGIGFFGALFAQMEFVYPVTGLVAGLGLVLLRDRTGLMMTVRGVGEALARALLPLTALIGVAFAATLPFTGLQPLQDSLTGTPLLLTLVAFVLLFYNAERGCGAHARRYPPPVQALVVAALLILPAAVAFAGWRLGVRVAADGWSVPRYWQLLVIATLGAFTLGYAALLLRHLGRMPRAAMERWNTVLAFALAAALVLVNTPPLDFRRLAANDQLERLQSGAIEPDQFNALQLYREGRYGVRVLETVRDSELGAAHPELRGRVDAALDGRPYRPDEQPLADAAEVRRVVVPLPGSEPPDSLMLALGAQRQLRRMCVTRGLNCRIGHLDVQDERWWVVYAGEPAVGTGWLPWSLLVRSGEDGAWLHGGELGPAQCPRRWRGEVPPPALTLLSEPTRFVRIGHCAYPLQAQLEPGPLPED